MMTFHKLQRGLSLIELTVAMAVSAIMLLGVTTIYTANKRSYQINDEMAGMQENARFALHTLTSAIRMAGNTGGMANEELFLMVASSQPPAPYAIDPARPAPGSNMPVSIFNRNTYLTGHSHSGGNWVPPLGANQPPDFVPGTDAIIIRKASACAATVSTGYDEINIANPQVTVQTNCGFNQGDAVIVTNLLNSTLFTITNNPAGQTPTLMFGPARNRQPDTSYPPRSRVMKAEAIIYYIGTDPGGNNIGLYSWDLINGGPTGTLLIPNIEDMRITYGLDDDGDSTRSFDRDIPAIAVDALGQAQFQTAITSEDLTVVNLPVSSWSRVVRINLKFLLASDPVGTALKPYTFDNVLYPAVDTRSRREFNTVINIRNRTL